MKFTTPLTVTLVAAALFASAAPAKTQQKSATAQPTQTQLEERIKQLEDRLAKAENKAEAAAMEKDYITRVQKQYETYYEKAFNTQLGILSVLGIVLTALFFLAGKFTLDIFDSRTKSTLDATVAQLEKNFSEKIQTELETLRKQNADQLKRLEDGLVNRISEQEQNLKARSDFQFSFIQGLSAAADHRFSSARDQFRSALGDYKHCKSRGLFGTEAGTPAVGNLFLSFRKEDEKKFVENARQELASPEYDDLEDELTQAALDLDWLAPIIKERKASPDPKPKSEPEPPTPPTS